MSQTRSKWSMNIGTVNFNARETFTSSKLPMKKEVLERMIWFMIPLPKGSFMLTSKEWAAEQVADELVEHCVWSNVYPKHPKTVVKMVMLLYDRRLLIFIQLFCYFYTYY